MGNFWNRICLCFLCRFCWLAFSPLRWHQLPLFVNKRNKLGCWKLQPVRLGFFRGSGSCLPQVVTNHLGGNVTKTYKNTIFVSRKIMFSPFLTPNREKKNHHEIQQLNTYSHNTNWTPKTNHESWRLSEIFTPISHLFSGSSSCLAVRFREGKPSKTRTPRRDPNIARSPQTATDLRIHQIPMWIGGHIFVDIPMVFRLFTLEELQNKPEKTCHSYQLSLMVKNDLTKKKLEKMLNILHPFIRIQYISSKNVCSVILKEDFSVQIAGQTVIEFSRAPCCCSTILVKGVKECSSSRRHDCSG